MLDAPTGSGKTHLLAQYIRSLPPNTRVLSIVSRIGLTKSLAEKFDMVLYKNRRRNEYPDRLSCTLDHLEQLTYPDPPYDVVILDENGDTRTHTISPTIQSRIKTVLSNLNDILLNAKKVILCQHQMMEPDAYFFLSFEGVDLYDKNVVRRFAIFQM